MSKGLDEGCAKGLLKGEQRACCGVMMIGRRIRCREGLLNSQHLHRKHGVFGPVAVGGARASGVQV